jgi:hypothetical protein
MPPIRSSHEAPPSIPEAQPAAAGLAREKAKAVDDIHNNRAASLRAGRPEPDPLTYEPIRCRIAKNVPTLTKIVTPMENTSLTSSTCLVSR